MAKHLLLAVFTMLCFVSARAQNAFDSAILLYKWKNGKLPDSASLSNVGRILGDKEVNSSELTKLRSAYQQSVFDAELKRDRKEVYKKVIRYITDNPATRNPALNHIKTDYDAMKVRSVEVEKWTDSLNKLKNYSGFADDALTVNINKFVKSNCTDTAKRCIDSLLKIKINEYNIAYASKIGDATADIKKYQANIVNAIDSLGRRTSVLQDFKIIAKTEIQEFTDNVRVNKFDPPATIVITDSSNEKAASSSTASLSNFKMPSESEIIDAVAVYLAKRVKQEAIIYFVDNLRKKVDSAQLAAIFPETSKKFFSWDAYSVPSFDNSWRYAFSKDLVKLPRLGFEYLETHPAIIKPKRDSGLRYVTDALLISEKVIKHYNFIEIVESLANDEHKITLLKSDGLRAFLRLTYIINQELYEAKKTKDYWITSDKFSGTMNNDEVMRIFSEIIIKKYPDIAGYLNVDLNNLQGTDLAKFRSWIGNVLSILNHFQENQNQTLGSDGGNFNINNYWSNLNEVINTVLSQQSEGAVIRDSKKFAKGLEKVNDLFEVYQLLQGKNYAAAANNCIGLMNAFIDENHTGARKFKNATELISFSSNLLQARNKDDLAAAIESYALPPASFRLKQNFSRVISVGAYFGPYGGVEFIRDECPGAIMGFSAPLTLDLSFNTKSHRSYTTWSLIVFDLGSVVSYRLGSTAGGLPQKVRWAQLFSPGLAVRFGLGNTPLTFSLGAQMNPQLRDFSGEGHKDAIRAYAGLFIDMPLLLLNKK